MTEDVHFTGLYKRYFPLVQQYIRTQAGTAHPEAEDIAQDIFLILWRRREKLMKFNPLENYLFIMVKNRLVNDRKKTSLRLRIWSHHLQPSRDFIPTSHQQIDSQRAERWLHAAIDRLPSKPRTVYMLRERHGLKVHEIAALTGISPTGASRKLREAENEIRSFIGRQMI